MTPAYYLGKLIGAKIAAIGGKPKLNTFNITPEIA